MLIVPDNAELEAEVMVKNKDIHWLSVGQSVNIKLHTYPYTRYGHITGTLRQISSDAVKDDSEGWVYPARITLQTRNTFYSHFDVQPGMMVTSDVIVGQRSLLEFFLSPLARWRKEAFRETI